MKDTLQYATKYLIRAVRPSPSFPCYIALSFCVLSSIRKHHIQLAFVGIITVRNSCQKFGRNRIACFHVGVVCCKLYVWNSIAL